MRDRRYTFNREWVGYPLPRWVVRFCGEFISHHHSRLDAILAGAEHGTARRAAIDADLAAAQAEFAVVHAAA